MIPVLMVVYWMMIFWLKQSDTWKLKQSDTWVNGGLLNDDIWLKQSDTCVNGGLLKDDTLIKTKGYLEIKWYKVIPVSMVVYWMMILWLKKVIPVSMVVYWMDTWLKQSDTCVNSGLLNDDTLIKTKWYFEIKAKWYLCQWWFIEWWYFD